MIITIGQAHRANGPFWGAAVRRVPNRTSPWAFSGRTIGATSEISRLGRVDSGDVVRAAKKSYVRRCSPGPYGRRCDLIEASPRCQAFSTQRLDQARFRGGKEAGRARQCETELPRRSGFDELGNLVPMSALFDECE
jgi:hypothetical protein